MQASRTILCDRTRALVSCGLDTSLHDLERRFLEAHLRQCPECRSFAHEADWFTNVIRTAAPLESMPPVVLPRRRRRVQLGSVASVASAAAILVVAGNVALTPAHNESEQVLAATALAQGPLGSESIRSLLRDDLASGRLSIVANRPEPGLGAVKPLLPPAG